MRTVTPAETESVAVGHDGNRYVMTDYLGSFRAPEPGRPQAYLVQQESPELRPHFHEVDQFQVVIGGTGTLGRQPVGRGVLHYADAFTPYGPIRTEPSAGLAYLTLRREPATGLNYMPEEREKRRLAGGLGGHFTCVLDDAVPAGPRPTVLARTDRGALAAGVRLPAGEALDVGGLPEGAPGYAVVLTGSVVAGGRTLPEGSLVDLETVTDLAGLRAADDDGELAEVAVVLFAPGS
ncbi:hypothetical protein [Blastococcus sp. SYSU D00820]